MKKSDENLISTDHSAKFNSGLLKIQRLHDCRVNLRLARFYKRYDIVFNGLLSYWSELDYEMSEKEKEKAGKFVEKITKAFRGKSSKNIFTGTQNPTIGDYPNLMFEFELYLAKIEHRLGLGMVSKDEDEGL